MRKRFISSYHPNELKRYKAKQARVQKALRTAKVVDIVDGKLVAMSREEWEAKMILGL